MTWWEEAGIVGVGPGELGGEEIFVENITDRLGRRMVAPLLPGADRRPPAIDLGKTEAPWQVSAYVHGNYLPTYKRLRALFDQPGPYTFTHPWLGSFSVDLPDGIEFEQDMARGGIAFVRFTAIPASELDPFSEPVASPRDQVRTKAEGAKEMIAEGFVQRYPGTNFLNSLDLATGWVGDMADRLDDAARRTRSFASPVSDLTDALQDMRASAKALAGLPGELARTVGALVASIFSFIPTNDEATADARASRSSVLDALNALASWDADPPEKREGLPSATLNGYAAAFEALLGGLALAEAELVLRELPLESTVEAASITETILEIAEKYIQAPGIDEVTEEALNDLRTTWATYTLGQTLPEEREVVLTTERTGIVMAMELYGDPTRGEEIAELNDLIESSFIPAGVPLRVLSS